MKVVFGLKAHSGWAALVVIGRQGGEFVVVDRRRLELVEHEWAKQPYHAAEGLEAKEARELVKRGIEAARKIARRELKAAVKRDKDRGNEVAVVRFSSAIRCPIGASTKYSRYTFACTRRKAFYFAMS
jgi:hypothetical protein